MKVISHRSLKWLAGAMMVGGVLLLAVVVALSQAGTARASAVPAPALASALTHLADNAACLACHGQVNQMGKYPNGNPMPISILPATYGGGVHGTLDCTKCHKDLKAVPPHRDLKALKIVDERDYTISYKETCKECHETQYKQVQDSIHTQLMVQEGNLNAPVCGDCHDAHGQKKFKDASGKILVEQRANIAKTCAKCHNTIFEAYATSVHGKGVLTENNPDVPTCIDCHGVHTIGDARTVAFRNSSIELCAKCHTDAKLMGKYKLSTEVMNTYVADFHGTTVTLFEKQTPDQPTNKPVCYDCHGVHDILRADDPKKGLAASANLLKTCQRCHPDANESFNSSWLSHYIPSPTKYPLVYYVNLFYLILIPVVLGGMALIIATDIYQKIRTRGKRAHAEAEAGETTAEQTTGKEE